MTATAPQPLAAATTTAHQPLAASPTSTPTRRAVVAIPALEPGAELVQLVGSLVAEGIDVIVVDDGSGPRFAVPFDRCALLGAEVVRFAENRGKGAALRAAFAFAAERFPGSSVVTADADGQHTLADIRAIRDRLDVADPAAAPLVIGVRSFAADDVPLRSRFGNAVSALLFRLAAGEKVSDTQTGLRGVPAAHLDWAQSLPGDRYEYEYTMLVRAARDGLGIDPLPIATVYLEENAASHFRPVRDSLRVLGPVLAFGASGALAFAVDTALFLGLVAIGAPMIAALAAARVLSGGMNFALNRWLVFRGGQKPPVLRSLLRYAALAAVVLAGGVLLVDAIAAMGAPLLGAKLAADAILFGLSFAVQRMVVFRER